MLRNTEVPYLTDARERVFGRGAPENVLAPIVISNQGMLQACSIGNAPDACALKASLREFRDRSVQNGRARGKRTLLLP